MPSLTVWQYDSGPAAEAAEVRLKRFEQLGLLTVHDAVTVSWMPSDDAPTIRPMHHATTTAAAKGSVLGLIIGSLVLAPAVGAAAGAGVAALRQRLHGSGVGPEVLASVRRVLVPGTSALVVLSSDENVDAIEPLLHEDAALVHVSLAQDAPEALREAAQRHHPEGGDADHHP